MFGLTFFWHTLDFSNPISISLSIFLCAFLFSVLGVYIIRKQAIKWGLVDLPCERKVHTKVMPKGGGIAILISFILACLLGGYWLEKNEIPCFFADEPRQFFAILFGAIIISVLGLVDDLYNLNPYIKLVVESLVAILLIFYDIRITLFIPNYIFFIPGYLFSIILTWGWIVLITNAFNLLDNMDGLCAGIAFIVGTFLLIVAAQTQQWIIVFILASFLGAALGFLLYNFPPASIFMGDCGSLLLGYLLATLTIATTFFEKKTYLFPIALPLLIMALPLYDTITVIRIRLKIGHPIMQGDKNHFSHRLKALGMTTRQTILTIYSLAFAIGIGAILLYQVNNWGATIIIIQAFLILAVIYILEQVHIKNLNASNQKNSHAENSDAK